MIHIKELNKTIKAELLFLFNKNKIKKISKTVYVEEEDLNENISKIIDLNTYNRFWDLTILRVLDDYVKETWLNIESINFDYKVKIGDKIIKDWFLKYQK